MFSARPSFTNIFDATVFIHERASSVIDYYFRLKHLSDNFNLCGSLIIDNFLGKEIMFLEELQVRQSITLSESRIIPPKISGSSFGLRPIIEDRLIVRGLFFSIIKQN